jgi:hypothetical protein
MCLTIFFFLLIFLSPFISILRISARVISAFSFSFKIHDTGSNRLAKKTGKSDQYIQNKVKAMQQRDIPVKINNGKQQPYVQTSLFEPVSWILKEKENAEMTLADIRKIEMNGDRKINKKKKIVKHIVVQIPLSRLL